MRSIRDLVRLPFLFGGVLLLLTVGILRIDFSYESYRGDGTFADDLSGAGGYSRFEVNFGAVDLSKPGRRHFQFSHLPKGRFTLGLDVSPGIERRGDEYLLEPLVRLVLRNERGEVVVEEQGRLRDWLWSRQGTREEGVGPAFVYRAGRRKEIPLGEGTVRVESAGVRADGGWGTYFDPRTNAAYTLTFEVIEGEPVARKFRIRLVMNGGAR